MTKRFISHDDAKPGTGLPDVVEEALNATYGAPIEQLEADKLDKAEAADAYQPKGEYADAAMVADLTAGKLDKTEAAGLYATHAELSEVATGQEVALTGATVAGAIQTEGNPARAAVQGVIQSAPDRLLAWALSEAWSATGSVVRNPSGAVTSAAVQWPDGAAGVFTATTINAVHGAVDAYTITHTGLGRTITQPPVTRNADGAVTVQPALAIA